MSISVVYSFFNCFLLLPLLQVNTEVMPQLEADTEVEGKSKVTPHAILLDIKMTKLDVQIKRAGEVENPLAGAGFEAKPKAVKASHMESFTEEDEEEEDDDNNNKEISGDVESQMSATTNTTKPEPLQAGMGLGGGSQHAKKKGRGSHISVTVLATSGVEAFEVADNVQPAEVVIICPLPTKDPLIEYRKMYDLMNALGGQKGVDIGGLKVSRKRKEKLLQHKNKYSWRDAVQGNIEVSPMSVCTCISLVSFLWTQLYCSFEFMCTDIWLFCSRGLCLAVELW